MYSRWKVDSNDTGANMVIGAAADSTCEADNKKKERAERLNAHKKEQKKLAIECFNVVKKKQQAKGVPYLPPHPLPSNSPLPKLLETHKPEPPKEQRPSSDVRALKLGTNSASA